MDTEMGKTKTDQQGLAAALPQPLDAYYHELWTCGSCGRGCGACRSWVAQEQRGGGPLARWWAGTGGVGARVARLSILLTAAFRAAPATASADNFGLTFPQRGGATLR